MNYETATKNTLTRELAFLLNKNISPISSYGDNDGVIVYPHDNEVNFDPCKNWSDIMPIAVELGVSLEPDADSVRGWWFAASRDTSMHSRNENGNPQRALVICCIKVLEAQANEKK